MKNCDNCGKETKNKRFCSRLCSSIVTNKESPKRSAKIEDKFCKTCGTQIPTERSKNTGYILKRKLCKECSKIKDFSLKEASERYLKHGRPSAFAMIRNRARNILKHIPNICENCGYSKHVEVCHIRPISSFPENTPISQINSRDNLKILCPNCHWEFDHGGIS